MEGRSTGFTTSLRIFSHRLHTSPFFGTNFSVSSLPPQKQTSVRWTAKVELSPNSGLFQSDLCQSQPVLICNNSEGADENWLRVTEATLEQP